MVQQLIVYAIVAVAAGWTLWSMFLRGWLRRRAVANKAAADCGPDCACGD